MIKENTYHHFVLGKLQETKKVEVQTYKYLLIGA